MNAGQLFKYFLIHRMFFLFLVNTCFSCSNNSLMFSLFISIHIKELKLVKMIFRLSIFDVDFLDVCEDVNINDSVHCNYNSDYICIIQLPLLSDDCIIHSV
ncbi:hypothetical protein KSF78_0004435 [Schistosoma japonicum]|nr:hypothetical protein KSF78_0004435 [Schistosoma japonicum]